MSSINSNKVLQALTYIPLKVLLNFVKAGSDIVSCCCHTVVLVTWWMTLVSPKNGIQVVKIRKNVSWDSAGCSKQCCVRYMITRLHSHKPMCRPSLNTPECNSIASSLYFCSYTPVLAL